MWAKQVFMLPGLKSRDTIIYLQKDTARVNQYTVYILLLYCIDMFQPYIRSANVPSEKFLYVWLQAGVNGNMLNYKQQRQQQHKPGICFLWLNVLSVRFTDSPVHSGRHSPLLNSPTRHQ